MSKLRQKFDTFLSVAEQHRFISPLVHIGQFKEDCRALLSETVMDFHKKEDFSVENLSRDMKVAEETIKELEEVCSPTSLVCPRENELQCWDDPSEIPEATGLVALDHWKKINYNRLHGAPASKRLLKSKYSELGCSLLASASQVEAENKEDVVQCPEIVVTVTVYFPRNSRRFKACGVDYFVLGSQKLSELRDKIPCILNEQPVGDFTNNPDHPVDIKLKDICTSALFYIENTFFNDRRSPSSIDLSKSIIEWAKSNETALPAKPQVADMDQYTFNDLKIRLGCPYIFLHQGDCEHIVIFKDIRLFNSSDCQSRSRYPFTVSRANIKCIPCQICSLYASTWYTRLDELAECDPAFFCERCFRTLHYDKQGNKLGNFTAFHKINPLGLDY